MTDIIMSPSKLFAFETCPKQFHLKYVMKAYPPKQLIDVMHTGSLVHKILEYLAEYPVEENIEKCTIKAIGEIDIVPTPEMVERAKNMVEAWFSEEKFENDVLASEYEFINQLDEDVTIRGIIDRVEQVSKNCIKVIDYKTGYRMYTREDLIDSNQLLIYAMAAYDKWPVDTIIICYDMVAHNRRTEVMVKPSDFADKHKYLQEVYKRIIDGEKDAILSEKCAYCWYKFTCKEYLEYIQQVLNIKNIHDIMEGNFEESIEYLVGLDNKKKVLEAHISEVKSTILSTMISAGEKRLSYGNYDLRTVSPTKREYNVSVIAEMFPNDFNRVFSPRKRNIDSLMSKKSVEDRAKIMATATAVEGHPYLRIQKKKGKKST